MWQSQRTAGGTPKEERCSACEFGNVESVTATSLEGNGIDDAGIEPGRGYMVLLKTSTCPINSLVMWMRALSSADLKILLRISAGSPGRCEAVELREVLKRCGSYKYYEHGPYARGLHLSGDTWVEKSVLEPELDFILPTFI